MNFDLSPEQQLLIRSVRDFSDREISPRAGAMERSGRLGDDLILKMARIGLLGMNLPEHYGGSSSSALDCVLGIEQLGYSGTAAWWLMAFGNSIPECIYRFGSNAQQELFLRPITEGQAYPSLQFTEPDTGSDPGKLMTRAEPLDADQYILNGTKRFSTFGNRPGCAVVFARDHQEMCTAFLIDKHTPGYSAGPNYELMGSGGIEASDVFLDQLRLHRQSILGEPGQGMSLLSHWIAYEKIQQCAACTGIAAAALDEAIAYAKGCDRLKKTAAGRQSIHQGIQWMVAEMHANLQACRWLTYRTASLKDADSKEWKIQAAAAKLFVVPTAMEVVNKARMIHGAYGYTREYKIERLYRAIAGASAIAVGLEINKSMVGAYVLR